MIIWAGVAALVLAMVLVCAAGWIKPGQAIGLRIPATQRSLTAWRAGHRAAIPAAITGTAVIVAALVVTAVAPVMTAAMMILSAAAFVGEVVWMLVAANRAGAAVSAHHS